MKYNLQFTYCGKKYEALIFVQYNVFDDGIGAYEFWGAKYFDKNNWQIEIEGYKILGVYLDGEEVCQGEFKKEELVDIVDQIFYSVSEQDKMRAEIRND